MSFLNFINDHFTALTFLGSIIAFVPKYFQNEKLKREQEDKKRKELSLMVYRRYLYNYFSIYKNKNFDPNSQDMIEYSNIMQCEAPLLLPDNIIKIMVSIQENVKEVIYMQLNNHSDATEIIEKKLCAEINNLIVLMRKDIMPDTKISQNDIETLLIGTDFKFISFVREKLLKNDK
ncbi:MAG: hypothetical protein ACRCVW_02280 [Brevinema sp.]